MLFHNEQKVTVCIQNVFDETILNNYFTHDILHSNCGEYSVKSNVMKKITLI